MDRRQRPLQTLLLVVTTVTLLWCLPVALGAQEEPAPADTTSPADTITIPETPEPPLNVVAKDQPNDGGGAIIVTWEASPSEDTTNPIDGYYVMRSSSADGPFEEIGDAPTGATRFQDGRVADSASYYYRVGAFRRYFDAAAEPQMVIGYAPVVGPVSSSAQWFNMSRIFVFILIIIVSGAVIYYIRKARAGEELYIRRLAGIEAVDEAVGRATEMGRKVFYVPGIMDMNDVQTIAGIAILGRVAQLAAEYDTWLEVPVSKSLVMVTARETMKEAYTKIGRPDAFQDDQVHYLTDDQFGYAAAIDGMVVREKPATIFYMGAFFAESLILAETGNAAGAIQIAGTAMPAQLPFFVAACDYTLIGEELFAASAYLSREPRQLGSLKGQDVGKAIFLLAILVGIIVETIFGYNLSQFFEAGTN